MEPQQVQLVCLDATLVITSTETRMELIPTLLELLFYGEQRGDGAGDDGQPFLSYVESQHEVSVVLDERLLDKFPDGALEYEPIRWKALQVASAGTGAFLSQLAVLTELTSALARRHVSVFQISTYQSDYVLVKVEDLDRAVRCLQRFCVIEHESGEELHAVLDGVETNNNDEDAGRGEIDEVKLERVASDQDVAVHQHVLSIPNMDLHLVQMDRRALRKHMFELVRLLFGRAADNLEADERGLFLSYSETVDGISIVTSDEAFLAAARELAESGDEGLTVSPDAWKVVQIGATKLGFSETGIVAGQTRVLVSAGTMVFYISTYATDFMLIKDDEWDAALPILQRHFDVIEGRFAPLQDQP